MIPDQLHCILIFGIFFADEPDFAIGTLADLPDHVKRMDVDTF
jgi:hypothetical protein